MLWDFVQRCWDDNRERRPKVAEVVEHLEKAAANWDGLMPPSVPVEVVAPDSEEDMSDSYREFTMKIPCSSQPLIIQFCRRNLPSGESNESDTFQIQQPLSNVHEAAGLPIGAFLPASSGVGLNKPPGHTTHSAW